MPEKETIFMPPITPLPEPLNSIPVNKDKYWSIWDQSKGEFQASGRSGIIIRVEPEAAYLEKLNAWLGKFGNTHLDTAKPYLKEHLIIQHDTQAKELYKDALAAGLTVELAEAK
jgi:hypothetical protein